MTRYGNGVILKGIDGETVGVNNGGIDVNLQDQVTPALDLRFIQPQNQTTISAQADPEDLTLTLTSTTGFIDGSVVGLFGPLGEFYFGTQIGAPAASVITLDTPIDKTFASGSNVISTSCQMAVNGSVTTQVFQIGPIGVAQETQVDITRVLGYIQTDSAIDDALFGNLAPLTNGVVLRHNNTVIDNIWNVKTNGDLGLLCFDAMTTDRAPAGSFGFRFRNTYAGQNKHGVAIRLSPGETLEILIQDNLAALESFVMMAQGHIVLP